MTEDDAKQKWCPMALVTSARIAANGSNRGVDEHYTRCLGSDCMMWRLYPRYYADQPQHGYCGLAGKLEVKP